MRVLSSCVAVCMLERLGNRRIDLESNLWFVCTRVVWVFVGKEGGQMKAKVERR